MKNCTMAGHGWDVQSINSVPNCPFHSYHFQLSFSTHKYCVLREIKFIMSEPPSIEQPTTPTETEDKNLEVIDLTKDKDGGVLKTVLRFSTNNQLFLKPKIINSLSFFKTRIGAGHFPRQRRHNLRSLHRDLQRTWKKVR